MGPECTDPCAETGVHRTCFRELVQKDLQAGTCAKTNPVRER